MNKGKRISSTKSYQPIKATGGKGESSIQEIINETMRRKIPIEAFIKEHLSADNVKNTVDIYCPVCGSDDVNVSTKQTRSIDEAATNHYKCLRCGFISKKFLKDNGSEAFKKQIKELNDNYRKSKK
jgi:DNA-directed RNA polymerase subunit M/transcription elongation factor TFIIS